MSEQVPRIQPVSSRVLRQAVIRLDSRKHPEKLKAIEHELQRRRVVEILARLLEERKAA